MSNSRHSSKGSVSFRREWRPSLGLAMLLLVTGPVAAFAVLASMLPRFVIWPLALGAVVQGIRLAREEWRRPHVDVHISGGPDAGEGHAMIDGRPVAGLKLDWRGPVAVLAWRDQNRRWHRRLWLPDHLPAAARRELRLAVNDFHASRTRRSVAP